MFGWLARHFTPAEPIQPRVGARLTLLENRCDDFDSRIEYLASELKKVRGRQFALEKSRQDGAGEETEQGGVPQLPPPPLSTAHLAKRFRGF